MTEHLIEVDLSDPRARAIADVMGNKTCKKILELLTEKEEMSEGDIASALDLPLNTIGYNMKKLVEAGLVDRSKNFFWSSRGKKISTYKISNKKIVISPKRMIKTQIAAVLGIALIGFIIVFAVMQDQKISIEDSKGMKKFNSFDELKAFIKERSELGMGDYGASVAGTTGMEMDVSSKSVLGGNIRASDYSKTNVQVEGVDEPDIVKSDGKYLYIVTGNKVVIVDAYPAGEMKKLAEIGISGSSIRNILIEKDKLIVLGHVYRYSEGQGICNGDVCLAKNSVEPDSAVGSKMIAPEVIKEQSFIYVYDLKDRKNPKLIYDVIQDGNYLEARLIDNQLYVITNSYVNINRGIILPVYSVNGIEKRIAAEEIYYHDVYDSGFVFTGILVLNLDSGKSDRKVYLTGASGTIYVSKDNVYLTSIKRISPEEYYRALLEIVIDTLPEDKAEELRKDISSGKNKREIMEKAGRMISEYIESLSGEEKAKASMELEKRAKDVSERFARESERTIIHKIEIKEGTINYIARGEVYGRTLNQFSLDEYDGNLRVATTTSSFDSGSFNHLYVLDENMKVIGSVENLAKGEIIYSVRFIGARAYMVTFKTIDPLFVIDLEDAKKPKVLGYLKIPGYSNYLHPYDDNHVIGIGKDAVEANGRALQQGMKISLFDVSNVESPKEKWSMIIGDRGTDSPALYDHKAFLFDKEKNLLVLPVMLAKINESKYKNQGDKLPEWAYGESVWQGAYVFNISSESIEVRGNVTHFDENMKEWKFHDYRFQIQRSLYMDDVLYTVSQSKIKANDLGDLRGINGIEIFEGKD